MLTLWLPKEERAEDARGLLLVRAADRALLDRMVAGLNAAQLKSGALRRVTDRDRGGTAYHVREFRPGRGSTEYYAGASTTVTSPGRTPRT